MRCETLSRSVDLRGVSHLLLVGRSERELFTDHWMSTSRARRARHPLRVDLCSFGHLAHAKQLSAHGFTRAALAGALQSGQIVRLQRGTYACAHLDRATAACASIGGALTCISVLRERDVWSGNDRRVHAQLSPHSSARVPPSIRAHREFARFGMESPWRATPLQALWQAMRCLGTEDAIAAMESAIHEKLLTEADVRRLGVLAPRRLERGVKQLISNSGSGNETKVRLRLVAEGYRVEPQGVVPGLGHHQDLVVEDCIGLEIDSKKWHGEERIATDADRDLRSEGLGRHVLRIRPEHVDYSWPQTLAVIDRAVTDARRLRH